MRVSIYNMHVHRLKKLIFVLFFLYAKILLPQDINQTPADKTVGNIVGNIFENKYSVHGRFNVSLNFSPTIYSVIDSASIKFLDKQIISLTENILKDYNKNIDKVIQQVNNLPSDVFNCLSQDLQNKLQETSLKESGITIDLLKQFLSEFDTRVPKDLASSKDAILEVLPDGLESIIRGMQEKKTLPKAFGLSFGLDYKVLNWLAPSIDIGFVIIERNSIGYLVDIKTMPWSVGARMFPSSSAPYGFFFYPKIGGTYLSFDIKDIFNGRNIINVKEHGLYLSVEMGYRIELFPKSLAKKRVGVGIDISFFDIGYYVDAWDTKILNKDILFLNNHFKLSDIFNGTTAKLLNIRLLLLPRIGVSIKF